MGKKRGSKAGGHGQEKRENLRPFIDGNTIDLSHQDRKIVPVVELGIPTVTHGLITEVNLSGNGLDALPETFGALSHLVKLNLSENGLAALPESFGDLTSLRWLDLFGNHLTRLPHSFGGLKALRWLDLKGNPINEGFISAEVIGPCSDENECRLCAKRVVARVDDLWQKKLKNDQRLQRKKQREEEEAKAAEKAQKAIEKEKRRQAWIEANKQKQERVMTAHQRGGHGLDAASESDALKPREMSGDAGAAQRGKSDRQNSSNGACRSISVVLQLVYIVAVFFYVSNLVTASDVEAVRHFFKTLVDN
jgi:hypothetical protein